MNVIISCGKKKSPIPRKAYMMYSGVYYNSLLRCAMTWISLKNIYIFSAKYGIIRSDTIIEPYEQRINKAGGVSLETIEKQISKINSPIYYLGGKEYLTVLRKIRNDINAPFQDWHKGSGINTQQALLNRWRSKKID